METRKSEISRIDLVYLISRSCIISFLFLLISCVSIVTAQEKKYHFFRPYTYGSDALFNPITVLMNGGFDSFQIINDREPTWKNVYWDKAGTNVWRSITKPTSVIDAFGWNRFFSQEIFPTNLKIEEAQYVPNIVLHSIGGGMVYRKISEWYDYNHYPMPYVLGAATSMAYEYINEVVENGPGGNYPNVDCIPDLLIFQPIGILLFSFDGISEYFSSTLNMNDWSQQTAFSFSPFAIRNAGQNFVMKLSIDQQRTKSIFFHFGDFAILGLSLKTNTEDAISFGAGLASNGRKSLPKLNGIPYNTVTTGAMIGIYYDRNNSLLASIVYADVPNHRFRLNIYPGLLSNNYFVPGLFLTVSERSSVAFGITAKIFPVGLSVHSPNR